MGKTNTPRTVFWPTGLEQLESIYTQTAWSLDYLTVAGPEIGRALAGLVKTVPKTLLAI